VTGEFGSGEEALEKLLINPPNFVLMDIELPGMSGIECTRELDRIREVRCFTLIKRFFLNDGQICGIFE